MEADQDPCQIDVVDDVLEPAYRLVVWVMRLSSVKATSSVPKNASRAATTALLWQACAEGYSGKFGVAASGCQLGSATVAGLPSLAACGIAW